MTRVWPALWPPWNRTTTSARADSQSTIFPLPSSPHWAPITATLAMGPLRTLCEVHPPPGPPDHPPPQGGREGARCHNPSPLEGEGVRRRAAREGRRKGGGQNAN